MWQTRPRSRLTRVAAPGSAASRAAMSVSACRHCSTVAMTLPREGMGSDVPHGTAWPDGRGPVAWHMLTCSPPASKQLW